MINYNQLKPGVIFILDGEPYEVTEFNFMRMQQRKPVAQTKIKNLITGKILSRTFQHSDVFEEADIEKKNVKYLYGHRGEYWFCEANNSANRFKLSQEQIGNAVNFLKPNTIVETLNFNGNILNITLPIKMDFKVIEAPPATRGNTVQSSTKVITIETGAQITVPLFINEGDIIKINTQTGEYAERVEKGK